MKKSFKKVFSLLFFVISGVAISNSTVKAGAEIGLPGDSGHYHCRCHGSSCQGGNAYSLRQSCGVNPPGGSCAGRNAECGE